MLQTHLSWILKEEKISFNINDLVPLVNQYYPDLRKCINTIQLSTTKEEDELHPTNYITVLN